MLSHGGRNGSAGSINESLRFPCMLLSKSLQRRKILLHLSPQMAKQEVYSFLGARRGRIGSAAPYDSPRRPPVLPVSDSRPVLTISIVQG